MVLPYLNRARLSYAARAFLSTGAGSPLAACLSVACAWVTACPAGAAPATASAHPCVTTHACAMAHISAQSSCRACLPQCPAGLTCSLSFTTRSLLPFHGPQARYPGWSKATHGNLSCHGATPTMAGWCWALPLRRRARGQGSSRRPLAALQVCSGGLEFEGGRRAALCCSELLSAAVGLPHRPAGRANILPHPSAGCRLNPPRSWLARLFVQAGSMR